MKKPPTTKAVVAKVDFGFAVVEGLMLPDGSFAIGVSQLASLISVPIKHSSRDFKTLLGSDFSFPKVVSEIHASPVNILTLEQAAHVIVLMSIKGNTQAQALNLAMATESFERRFMRAFGQRVSEDEMNARLKLRMERIQARLSCTDELKAHHLAHHHVAPDPSQYRSWTTRINLALFGQSHFNCNRDTMTTDQQMRVKSFEYFLSERLRDAQEHATEVVIDWALKVWSGKGIAGH